MVTSTILGGNHSRRLSEWKNNMQRQHTYVSFKALSKRFEDSMTDVTYLNFEGLNILTGLMTLLNVGLSTSLPESLNMKKYSLKVYEQMLSAREIPL